MLCALLWVTLGNRERPSIAQLVNAGIIDRHVVRALLLEKRKSVPAAIDEFNAAWRLSAKVEDFGIAYWLLGPEQIITTISDQIKS